MLTKLPFTQTHDTEWEALMIIWCMQPDGNKRSGATQKLKDMKTTAERKRWIKCRENG